ncbi:Trinucleotide repeat-containing gene 6A protein [Liparis tanakae]|uniref:Trinucleotide repeat-containing gene 6A protein n=1 Tax=Liparis tanakae TaxID=230148 RepID=A0A4Z2I099_9TELE|nr:Trinucleotide repeat-containing gene 6A protein [Liparis tanakae]
MDSPSCRLIGRGRVMRAEMDLIKDVRHKLQIRANRQLDPAGGGMPEPAPTKPSPGPPRHLHQASPTLPLSSSSSSSSGNGKRAPSSSQLPTPPLPQQPLSSASARYPPREVPPRFRQQEHKQLLKRGQPLPAGALTLSSSSSSPSASHSSSSSKTTSSTSPNSATSTAGKRHPGLPLTAGFIPSSSLNGLKLEALLL